MGWLGAHWVLGAVAAGALALGGGVGAVAGSSETTKTTTVVSSTTSTQTVPRGIKTVRKTKTVLQTETKTVTTTVGTTGGRNGSCDEENYSGACVPPISEQSVNCPDILEKDFQSIGTDPQGLDHDGDGVACES